MKLKSQQNGSDIKDKKLDEEVRNLYQHLAKELQIDIKDQPPFVKIINNNLYIYFMKHDLKYRFLNMMFLIWCFLKITNT